jgi:hypothetical protein
MLHGEDIALLCSHGVHRLAAVPAGLWSRKIATAMTHFKWDNSLIKVNGKSQR